MDMMKESFVKASVDSPEVCICLCTCESSILLIGVVFVQENCSKDFDSMLVTN